MATPYQPTKITKKSVVTYKVGGPVYNIIVLVSGTTDPINATSKDPSHSYPSPKKKPGEDDGEWYWKYEYNGKKSTLFDDVKKLESDLKKYNVAVFSAHGWSGDNSVKNRAVSGGYLVDRLCGSNGEKPYYQKYLKNEVHFHLIGHSHGGNVINEMTKRMAACKEWPARWSVKTIVYLSTPFFQTIHQLDPTAMHPGFSAINVFNKYDLTQRVVANFSMHTLTGVMDVTGSSLNAMTAAIQQITGWKPDPKKPEDAGKKEIKGFNVDAVTEGLKSIRLRDFDDREWHYDPTWAMGPTLGAAMYKECIALFKNIDTVFDEMKCLIGDLNATLHFPVVKSLEGKIESEHQVVSDTLKKRFDKAIDTIKAGLKPTIKAFEARLKSKRFPVQGLSDDIHLDRFLRPIVEFLAVSAPGSNGDLTAAPEGSLLDLVCALLTDQVDKFDDTKNTPAAQLKKTAFVKRLVHVEITKDDAYKGQREAQFDAFMKHMERAEARYFSSKSQGDLLDILFTLIAQLEGAEGLGTMLLWIDVGIAAFAAIDMRWLQMCDAEFYVILAELFVTLKNCRRIFDDRDFGGIVVTSDKEVKADKEKKVDAVFKRGDLNHLMLVSHSVSRLKLYDDDKAQVKQLLVAQIKG